MELDDLKQVWQTERGIASERFDEICETFHKGSSRFRSTILQRDSVETAIAAAFFCFMLTGIYFATNWTMRLSLGFGCVGCVVIAACLWWGRRAMRPPASDFRTVVETEIAFLNRQIFLLKNIVWWYELPIGIGMVLFPMGSNNWRFDTISVIVFVIYELVILSALAWVWWVNQRAVKKQLLPLLEYHVTLRDALDGGDEELSSVTEPPAGFVEKPPPEPISRRALRWWIAATLLSTGSVLGSGIWLMRRFDQRTGVFVLVCSPVVAILVLYMSGLGRKPVRDEE